MMRNRRKSVWQQLDEKAGFHHDERTEQIQLLGVRRAYWLTAVLFPTIAAWHQIIYNTSGLWLLLTAVLLSLLYLLWRRRQLAPLDERSEPILSRSYRHAQLFLLLTLAGHLSYLFWRSDGALPGLFIWPPTILLTTLPLFVTHIQQRSYPTRTWQIIGIIGIIGLLAAYLLGRLAGQATP